MNVQGRLTAASLASQAPGGIVKGTAIVPLTRSQAVSFQRSEKHKVNVAIYRRQQIHYLRNSCLALLTTTQR
ncbi:hypothetical protein DN590_00795 [Citrobacter freundii]|nr:hypothetical protein DN590_00795 [Citrobacter freundii]